MGRLGDLRVLPGQPAARLGQHDTVDASGDGRQGRCRVPALDPASPGVRCSRDHGRPVTVLRRGRRFRVPEGRQGPVDAVQVSGEVPSHRGIGAQPGQRLAGQVLQPRAAVEQQHVADHGRQLSFAAAMVAPAGENVADLPDGIVNRVFAEHARGQRLAVEAPDAVERGEPARQVGVGEQIRACAGAHLPRPRLPELAGARPDQVGPVLRGPRQVRPAQLGAPCQHEGGRVPGEPPLMAGIRVPVQRGPGIVERLHQLPDRPPGRRAQVAVSAPEQFQPESTQAVQLGHGEQALPGAAFQVNGPWPGRRAGRADGSRRRCPGHAQRSPAGCPPRRASVSTRQSWMCCMPWLSLSARSRPDRWI